MIAMRYPGRALIVVLIIALAGYALDCVGMTTPEQAMQCCKTRCPAHHHGGQDCCKTMPSMQVAFSQPPSIQDVTVHAVTCGLVPAFSELPGLEQSERMIAEHSHAPPTFTSLPVLPLRI